MIKQIKKFFRNDEGSIAIIAAFATIGLFVLSGMAIELGRVAYVDTQLARAADAAAVAGARYKSEDAVANATKVFFANFNQGYMGVNVTPTVTVENGLVTVDVTGSLPTIFASLANINSLTVNAHAAALRSFSGLEVVLVLDVTGSMAYDNKLNYLKEAATNFVDTLYEGEETRENTKIALAPYVMVVNVGSENTNLLADPQTLSRFPSAVPWAGCVMAQGYAWNSQDPPFETHPLNDETDDAPGDNQLWNVYYAESTYSKWGRGGGWWGGYIANDNPYNPATGTPYAAVADVNTIGPNRSCGPPLQPFLNNSTQLKNIINAYPPVFGGGTNGALGLAWGWRLISENWDGVWGVEVKPYDAPDNKKVVILMTDGENLWHSQGGYAPANYNNTNYGDPSAYGAGADRAGSGGVPLERFRQGKAGWNGNIVNGIDTAINAKLGRVCESMKAKGIQIFTITFLVNSSNLANVYRNCASQPEYYFNANSGGQLIEFYEQIAEQIKSVRIVQ
jgi:Flp pilus assembly protein TadG